MIDFKRANKYCNEDISLIENYEQAVNNKTQIWDCHHRKETDEGLSKAELIKQGLYWNRPASELIFLTRSEHMRLHKIGNKNSAKAVYQIDKITGEIIKVWNCVSDVTKTLGIHQSAIVACCKRKPRRKSAGGFIWKYAV